MPLNHGKSDKARSENIAELIKAGHDPKQAEAIAYSEQRKARDDMTQGMYESNKQIDMNGWAEIKNNPISKVGVFPYSGRQISPELDPDTIYQVYRPESELSDPECIESFKLVPWTDEHAMLGNYGNGTIPAEKKGIQGVTGEDVYFADGYLKANLKVFSSKMADLIQNGKKELSIGYRCIYELESGVYNGVRYDAVQRCIRGNHVALVEEGRSGPDVAVLDHFKFSFDSSTELKMPNEVKEVAKDEAGGEVTLEAIAAKLDALCDVFTKMHGAMGKNAEDADPADFVNKYPATDADEEKKDGDKEKAMDADEEKKDDDKDDKKKDDKKDGMDSQVQALSKQLNEFKRTGIKAIFSEISQRDALAQKLAAHIGTFDHAEKTLEEVAVYGVKKLGLNCVKGHEHSALNGFLAATKKSSTVRTAVDSKSNSDQIDAYLTGGK